MLLTLIQNILILFLRSIKLCAPMEHPVTSQKMTLTVLWEFSCKQIFLKNINHRYFNFLFLNSEPKNVLKVVLIFLPISASLFLYSLFFKKCISPWASVFHHELPLNIWKRYLPTTQLPSVWLLLLLLVEFQWLFSEYSVSKIYQIAKGSWLCRNFNNQDRTLKAMLKNTFSILD